MSQKPYNLFLDDLRSPQDAYEQEKHEMFIKKEWVVVKNYDEFVSVIHNCGLPQLIAFDHDLSPEHYTPKEFWMDYAASMSHQDKQIYSVETGLDCAKFVIDYCQEYKQPLPAWYSHSANPIGRDRINDIMFYYERYHGRQNFTRSEKTILRKTLLHCRMFVDVNKLFDGIYGQDTPHLYNYEETIESLVEFYKEHCKYYGRETQFEAFKENISKCQLVEIEISVKL